MHRTWNVRKNLPVSSAYMRYLMNGKGIKICAMTFCRIARNRQVYIRGGDSKMSMHCKQTVTDKTLKPFWFYANFSWSLKYYTASQKYGITSPCIAAGLESPSCWCSEFKLFVGVTSCNLQHSMMRFHALENQKQ